MKNIIIMGIAALVVVLVIIGVLVFILGRGSSCSYITPSEAASVIGGSWTVENQSSYCFTVNNGAVTEKYFNGKTENMSLSSLGGSSAGAYLQYTPTSGMTEFLDGVVDGQRASIQANYATFSSSDVAQKLFSTEYSLLSSLNVQNVSSNEFIASYGGFGTYMYTVVKLSGNTVYELQVTVPKQLSTSQLTTLMGYL